MKIRNTERAENKHLLDCVTQIFWCSALTLSVYMKQIQQLTENIGWCPVCNAIIYQVKNKDSKTKKCWILIVFSCPTDGLLQLIYSVHGAKSLDLYLDGDVVPQEKEPLAVVDKPLTVAFHLSSCPVTSLLLIRTEASSWKRYSLTVSHTNWILSARLIAVTFLK